MKMSKQDVSQNNHREMIAALELAKEIAATESKKPNHYNHDFAGVVKDIEEMLSSDNGECGIKHWDSKVIGHWDSKIIGREYTKTTDEKLRVGW